MIASGGFGPVRILLDYRPALRQRTGVGEYVHESARALADGAPPGEVLVLFSSSWKDRVGGDVPRGATVVDRRIPVQLLNLLWNRAEWPAIERLAGPLDVVQSPHPLLLPSRRAARLVTVHDLDFLDHPERTQGEIRRDYPALAASHARRADRVVAVSRHTAAEVERRLGVPADRIVVCSPGGPGWAPREAEPRAGAILFLGTLEPRKNVSMLLDAYERALAGRPDLPPLVLAGPTPPSAAPLTARVARPPLAGRVEIAGYVAPEHKMALFDRALVFVLPSHTEGFGITAVEAMTRGVPVVAADRGALPEVVGSAGRLIDPTDPEALARVLLQILDDAGLRRRMREAGLAQARQYTWAETARRTREAWGAALEERARRHA